MQGWRSSVPQGDQKDIHLQHHQGCHDRRYLHHSQLLGPRKEPQREPLHSRADQPDKLKVLRRRLDPSGKDRALTELTKAGCSIDVWRPLLLWHIARGEYLLWDFLTEWLFERSDEGALFVSPEDLRGHIRELPSKGVAAQSHWTDSTVNKMTSALLKMGEDFGLLKGGRKREIAGYTLPEPSTMYLLHAIRDKEPSSHAMINAGDWRIFQMRPEDVERELVLLHQLGRLTYNAAGSIVELELPEDSALGYARRHIV